MEEDLGGAVGVKGWQAWVARYQKSDLRRSIWQLVNSFLPYCALWYGLVRSLEISYWLTLVLVVPAAGFLVRIFIILHDCGDGSFFRSRKANDLVGSISGVLVFTPYHEWRHKHAVHHATGSNLDRRGIGDMWMLTVKEYLARTRMQRLVYRIYRNPIVLFVLGPVFMFLVVHRFPSRSSGAKERRSVLWTNIALAALVTAMSVLVGFLDFVSIMLPVIWIAGSAGVWLFYVQHQFEPSYWERDEEWDFVRSAIDGSSFYKLPGILRWFSGNIGFHHVHHLSPKIPNYFLKKCHQAVPVLRSVPPITLLSSLRSLGLHLWDEQRQKYIGFGDVKSWREVAEQGQTA